MNRTDKHILTWKGKPVDGMTREELIKALEVAAKLYEDLLLERRRRI